MSGKKSFSDFWLNKETLYQYVPDGDFGNDFSVDLIQLAAYRRIVSNFVFILTKKDIPVQFNTDTNSKENFTDGETIFLSASVRRKEDFDWSVGLALHEASHILFTDFKVFQSIFSKIPIEVPDSLKKKAVEKNITSEQIAYLMKWVFNVIEDRYIDSYIFNEAPGYRGYYKALYEKLWNSDVVSKGLESDECRSPTLLFYEFRIINLTNPFTDLDALPGLRQIAELIDLENITRLNTTGKRMELSYKVAEIIIENLLPQEKQKSGASSTINAIHEKLSGKQAPTETLNETLKKNVGVGEFTEDQLKELSKSFNKQRDAINHKYNELKEGVSEEQRKILDTIENSNIIIVPTGFGLSGDYTQASVDAIVVKKLTRQLIDMGRSVFPFVGENPSLNSNKPFSSNEEAVLKGFALGKILGKKLQIRAEENPLKSIRKSSGKIERRLLADIGVGMESIFSRVIVEKYNKIRLHISVDASGSMNEIQKWCPTMTCLVAICVAASMIDNLQVSVSFRGTFRGKNDFKELPYVVLAYDSKVDKISKVRHLFPHLSANGGTPEGLAFQAISDEFIIGKISTEQDHYFLNISDGEPAYNLSAQYNRYGTDLDYRGETGALHTKTQIDRIRAKGVKIMSYFIKSNNSHISQYIRDLADFNQVDKKRQLTLEDLFSIMYGKDGYHIDVENVTDIARTLNKQFLSK